MNNDMSYTGVTAIYTDAHITQLFFFYVQDANVSQFVEKFKKSRLLLVHGTGDGKCLCVYTALLIELVCLWAQEGCTGF